MNTKIKKWRAAAVTLTMLMLAAGCIITTEPTEPTGFPYPTKSSFCSALAEVFCNAEVVTACYSSSEDKLASDTEQCVSTYSDESKCNPGGFKYDPMGAEACLVAVKDAYADAKLSDTEQSTAADACLAVFSGSGASGDACDVDTDCDGAQALRCVAKPGAAGSCQEPTTIDAGLSCADDNAVCGEGFYCGSDQACIQRPGVGTSCAAEKPCDESALCNEDVCEAKLENGESCANAEQCAGGFCVKAVGQTEGTCGAQLILSSTTEKSCEPMLFP